MKFKTDYADKFKSAVEKTYGYSNQEQVGEVGKLPMSHPLRQIGEILLRIYRNPIEINSADLDVLSINLGGASEIAPSDTVRGHLQTFYQENLEIGTLINNLRIKNLE